MKLSWDGNKGLEEGNVDRMRAVMGCHPWGWGQFSFVPSTWQEWLNINLATPFSFRRLFRGNLQGMGSCPLFLLLLGDHSHPPKQPPLLFPLSLDHKRFSLSESWKVPSLNIAPFSSLSCTLLSSPGLEPSVRTWELNTQTSPPHQFRTIFHTSQAIYSYRYLLSSPIRVCYAYQVYLYIRINIGFSSRCTGK